MKGILNRFFFFVTALLFLQKGFALEQCSPSSCGWDDWVTTCDPRYLCHGYYQELPIPPLCNPDLAPEKQPINATAERGAFALNGDSILKGNVQLTQGVRRAFAQEIQIHRDFPSKTISTISASEEVKLMEPGFRLDADHGFWNVPEDIQVFDKACFRLYERHARGTSDLIKIDKGTYFKLTNATYTTCAPEQNTWYLKAKKIVLNRLSGRGKAYRAKFYIKDIPVLYVPYLDFPIDDRRKTGFLYPGMNSTNQSGFEVSFPFYWNIAPNYDATLTPRFLSKRGGEMQGLFRYLLPQSRGTINAAVLAHDRAYEDFRKRNLAFHPKFSDNDPRVKALNHGNPRSSLNVNHTTAFSSNSVLNLYYHNVSDDNYFMDLGEHFGVAATTQLLQKAEVLYGGEYWKGQGRVQQYQTLHPFTGPQTEEVYGKLPQLAFQADYPDLPCDLNFTTVGDFTHFIHRKDRRTNLPFTTGDRFYLRPGLALPFITPSWYVRPRIQFHVLSYNLALGTRDRLIHQPKSPSLMLPIVDVDSGLIFERMMSLLNESYIQTLEPRLYYLYIPFHNQNNLPNFDTTPITFDYNQLYRVNRFSGVDRLGDANQVTLGVLSRFLTTETGLERFSAGIGQIYYLNKRRVTACNPLLDPNCRRMEFPDGDLKQSPIAGILRYHFDEITTVTTDVEWSMNKNRIEKGAFYIQHHPEALNVFNVGYQFLRRNPSRIDPKTGLPEKLQQIDTSFALGITPSIRILGRWNYDIRNHRSNDILAGIEQQGCCTAVRLSVSRFLLPYDTTKKHSVGVFLQFVFKGFAGVGHKMTPILKRTIPGYEWRADSF